MAAPRRPLPGAIAATLVLVVLLFTVTLGVYYALEHPSPAFSPFHSTDDSQARLDEGRRMSALLAVLLVSLLLILAFIVGAYLLIRIGRTLTQKRVGGAPTEYVDAWSRYRLSDEQIDDLTREDAGDGPEGDSPRGRRPE